MAALAALQKGQAAAEARAATAEAEVAQLKKEAVATKEEIAAQMAQQQVDNWNANMQQKYINNQTRQLAASVTREGFKEEVELVASLAALLDLSIVAINMIESPPPGTKFLTEEGALACRRADLRVRAVQVGVTSGGKRARETSQFYGTAMEPYVRTNEGNRYHNKSLLDVDADAKKDAVQYGKDLETASKAQAESEKLEKAKAGQSQGSGGFARASSNAQQYPSTNGGGGVGFKSSSGFQGRR